MTKIYVISDDPVKCVNNLPDKLLPSALEDICKVFNAVIDLEGEDLGIQTVGQEKADKEDPVVQWVLKSRDNYMWAMTYFFHLCIAKKESKYDIPVDYLELSGAAAYLGVKMWEHVAETSGPMAGIPEEFVNTTGNEKDNVFIANVYHIGGLLSK